MSTNSPLTRAERTEFAETSTHADVLAFLEALRASGADFQFETLATSTEGREVPLVVVADPSPSSAAERDPDKAVIYVQANIHGGEVEGKEAALMLLRDLLPGGTARPLLAGVTLLVVPIYNPDGNDAWGPQATNRAHQNGPQTIGQRPNGMGLDLNRDCMKAESPEMRGVLEQIYGRWNPDVVIDLHTTNGTRHGYDLTYSPALDPNTEPEVLAYTRSQLLPEARRRLRERFGIETLDYGNVDPDASEPSWTTFSPLPRFVTNYVGTRNRIAVLSEAASFLPFERRVEATGRFLREIIELIAWDAAEVTRLVRGADARVASWADDPDRAPELGVRFELDSRGVEPVLLERAPADGADRGPVPPRPEDIDTIQMPIFDRFRSTRTSRLPAAYALPPSLGAAVALLERQGVQVARLPSAWVGPAQRFAIDQLTIAEREFQGHRLVSLEGRFTSSDTELAPGTTIVPMAQPLAVLAFTLLEPESEDGLAAWGFLPGLEAGADYPVLKLYTLPEQKTAPAR